MCMIRISMIGAIAALCLNLCLLFDVMRVCC
jgi:hypothetical protein